MLYSKDLRVPRYRLHKPSGQAVVTLNGRDFYLGGFDSPASREKYDRLVAEWLANGRRLPSKIASHEISVVELILHYWRHCQTYYVKNGAPTSEQQTIRVALRIIKALYGHTPVCEFGPRALKAVREAMIDKGWCRNHINKQISRIKSMFKWGVESELVPASVHQALLAVSGLRKGRSAARETEPVRPVPEAHVEAIKPYVSRQVWAMIDLQRLTGMRSGEVTMMRGRDLDTSGKVWIFRPQTHKTEHHGHDREIALGPQAQSIIRAFLRPDTAAFLFSPRDAELERVERLRENRKTPIQPSQRRRSAVRRRRKRQRAPADHYSTASYRRALDRACGQAGVPQWHPHQLRHNAATRLRREFGIEAARVILGHRSSVVTEVYAEIDRSKAIDIMARVG